MKSKSHGTVTGGRPGSWNNPLDLRTFILGRGGGGGGGRQDVDYLGRKQGGLN